MLILGTKWVKGAVGGNPNSVKKKKKEIKGVKQY